MTRLLTFLAANRQGILLLLVLVVSAGAIVQWIAWMFGWGRFNRQAEAAGSGKALRFVFADLLVKIIDDFRHLLALVIVVIFALALMYGLVLVSYEPSGKLDALSKALQAVTSSLGGLIGAIIGYYFGEKAGEKGALAKAAAGATATTTSQTAGPAAQRDISPVTAAPPPPEKKP